MSVVTGDIVEVTVKHPLGDSIFEVKAAEDSTYDLGGFRSTDEANNITSGGKRVDQKNRTTPFFEATIIASDEDADLLSKIAGSPVQGLWTITHISGGVHRLTGTPVGDIQINKNNGQLTLKVAGDNQMEKVA